MTGILCAIAGAAAASPLDTQTVTPGTNSAGTDPTLYYSGYKSATPAIGSCSDGTSNLYSGASITGLYFHEQSYTSPPNGITVRQIVFAVSGTQSNSGWDTITIGVTSLNRTDATFSTSGGTSWTWNRTINDPFVSEGDPFSGSTQVVWY